MIRIDDTRQTGEEILHFSRWLLSSKYRLMARFLGDLKTVPSPQRVIELEARYRRALQHGERIYAANGVVSILLALGVLTAAASALADVTGLAAPIGPLERVAAVAASASIALIALRLAFDRYLERVDVVATFLATLLFKAAPSPGGPDAPRTGPTAMPRPEKT